MSLSDISIRRHVFAWMVMIGLMLFGLVGYSRLGVSQLPNIDFPTISVSLTWEGAAPEVMETDVVNEVEAAVMTVQGVKEVSSSIRQGSARVTLELEVGRDLDVAVQEVQTKINQVQRRLPTDIDPPIISKVNPNDQPIIWVSVSSETRSKRDLMEYVEKNLKDRFTSINGVGEVIMGGYVDPNLRVWIDIDKLNARELTIQDIKSSIQEQHSEIPAGRIESMETEQSVRVMGEARTAEEFGEIVITKRGGRPVFTPIRMKEIAAIEEGLDDIRRITRYKGRPTVGLGIKKQTGVNDVAVAKAVKQRLEEVRRILPPDIEANVVVDRTKYIEDSIHEMTFTLILSALVTSLVCWFFLGAWSATINILLAIPTSILGTFLVIYFLGFTLNTFTVLGLSLAVGIVVDDSIMVLENIVRYREQGMDRKGAAHKGANQIAGAAFATTMSLTAIFVPVVFISGIMGKFFFEFGVTIAVAVWLSLLEALMLTPMRCAQFLQVGRHNNFEKRVDEGFKWLARSYHDSLSWALKYRGWVILTSVLIFFASLLLVRFLKKEFVPAQDQSMFLVSMKGPAGSSIEFTDSRFKEAEKIVNANPNVERYLASVGGFGGGEVNQGNLFVILKDPKDRPVDPAKGRRLRQQELMNIFRAELKKVPDMNARVQDLSLSGFSAQRGFPVELSLRGPDWDKLVGFEKQMRERMEQSGLMTDVDSDYQEGSAEIHVVPDRIRARDRGVSMEAIGSAINALVGGERVGKYTSGDRRYDIRIRLGRAQRMSIEAIDKIWVWNNFGERVALREVVNITEKPAAMSITRRQRERAISVYANVAPGKSQFDAIAQAQKIAKEILPEGYKAVLTGSSQASQESSQNIGIVFLLGIVVAYMVLGSQYNSFLQPVIVLLALPFSISGAIVALLLTGQSINLYSMIGIILLMGIVKKNSILLVDFTNQVRHEGKSIQESLLTACPIRLRPILMTSLATISAALPPALALGPGAEVRIPMAITVIGGVLVSTIFTLFVVPCVYRWAVPENKH